MLGEWPHSASVEDESEAEVPDDVPPIEPPVSLPPPLSEPPPEPEPELDPAAVAPVEAWVAPELPPVQVDEPDEATGDAVQEPASEQAELAPALHDAVLARSAQTVARYSLDPLAEPPAKRRFGRSGTAEVVPVVEVPARPDGVRALPGRPTRQD